MWIRRKIEAKERFLVVGLGNPGSRYENTRHNVGFRTADLLAERCHVSIRKLKFKSLYAETMLGGKPVILLKPQTYMNLSGEAVREAAHYYQIPLERILVITDDTSLEPGRLRIRRKGSAGGHNGLKNIIACMGGDGFPRVKIGVGAPPHPEYDWADWVLGTFPEKEKITMETALSIAADAGEVFIEMGVEEAMNRFNATNQSK